MNEFAALYCLNWNAVKINIDEICKRIKCNTDFSLWKETNVKNNSWTIILQCISLFAASWSYVVNCFDIFHLFHVKALHYTWRVLFTCIWSDSAFQMHIKTNSCIWRQNMIIKWWGHGPIEIVHKST